MAGRASRSSLRLSGRAVFRVRAGDEGIAQITDIITIFIGPEPRWSDQPTPGICNLVWNGKDGAPPSAGIENRMVASLAVERRESSLGTPTFPPPTAFRVGTPFMSSRLANPTSLA